jgi:serine/threonine protein kinase
MTDGPSLIGRRIGAYEVLSLLGAGGMGEVYRVRDRRLDRDVALKIVRPFLAGDPQLMARLEREARLLATLNRSPSPAASHPMQFADGVLGIGDSRSGIRDWD